MTLRYGVHRPSYRTNRYYESPIHAWRVANGLTIRELSSRTGVAQTQISALANGTMSPVKEKSGLLKKSAKALCAFFGLEMEDLFPRYFCKIQEPKVTTWGQVEESFVSEFSRCQSEGIGTYSDELETVTRIRKMLSLLPCRRECMVTRYLYYGETLTSIAKDFRLSLQAIRIQVRCGLNHLRGPKIHQVICENNGPFDEHFERNIRRAEEEFKRESIKMAKRRLEAYLETQKRLKEFKLMALQDRRRREKESEREKNEREQDEVGLFLESMTQRGWSCEETPSLGGG